MARLALRMLLAKRYHFVVTAGGVAATIMLIVILLGVHRGAREGSTGFISASEADIWVCRDNSTNILRSNSFLRSSLHGSIASLRGVKHVSPMLRVLTSCSLGNQTTTLFLLGINPSDPLAGPPGVVPRGATVSSGGLIIDRSLALKHDLAVGSSVSIQGRVFRIDGWCTETNAVLAQFSFCTIEDAGDLLGFPGLASCFLVELYPDAETQTVAREVRSRFRGVAAFTKEEFLENTVREMDAGVLPVLWTVALLAMAAGAVVVTLLLYGSVLDRRQDYALLRAVGVRRMELYTIVLCQACSVTGFGALIGLLTATAIAPLLSRIVPELTLAISPSFAWTVSLAALAIACSAAVAPARTVSRVDPEEVFRT